KPSCVAALLLALFIKPAFPQSATGTPVPLMNPGFDDDVLSCQLFDCYVPGITGWSVGPVSGTYKPGPAQYPLGVPSGPNVAGIGNLNSTGSILQATGVVLLPNTTYVFKLSIGQRADVPLNGYVASILAGNVVLASDSNAT